MNVTAPEASQANFPFFFFFFVARHHQIEHARESGDCFSSLTHRSHVNSTQANGKVMSDVALMKKQGRIALNMNKLQLSPFLLLIGGLPGGNAEDSAEQDLRSVRGKRDGRQAACSSRPGRVRRDHLFTPHPNS